MVQSLKNSLSPKNLPMTFFILFQVKMSETQNKLTLEPK
jgi:hypothetical protein